MAQHVTVKVSHVPKDVSKEELSRILRKIEGTLEISIQDTEQDHNYAWVNCKDKTTAERVVSKLNGASVGREKTMLVARLRDQSGLGVHPLHIINIKFVYILSLLMLKFYPQEHLHSTSSLIGLFHMLCAC